MTGKVKKKNIKRVRKELVWGFANNKTETGGLN